MVLPAAVELLFSEIVLAPLVIKDDRRERANQYRYEKVAPNRKEVCFDTSALALLTETVRRLGLGYDA